MNPQQLFQPYYKILSCVNTLTVTAAHLELDIQICIIKFHVHVWNKLIEESNSEKNQKNYS